MPAFSFTVSGVGSYEDIAAMIEAAHSATGRRFNVSFPLIDPEQMIALTPVLARVFPGIRFDLGAQFEEHPPRGRIHLPAGAMDNDEPAHDNNARGPGADNAFGDGFGGEASIDDEVEDHRGRGARDGPNGEFVGDAVADEVEDHRGRGARDGPDGEVAGDADTDDEEYYDEDEYNPIPLGARRTLVDGFDGDTVVGDDEYLGGHGRVALYHPQGQRSDDALQARVSDGRGAMPARGRGRLLSRYSGLRGPRRLALGRRGGAGDDRGERRN
ncbi:hypothetical protein CONLIGDRAFT_677944 [Coniochaeta ligniaria NRRL 30616]|uniref:Uncharacterized protein n=1 Tax=Coniochaeta ligniaria NRRL 30616 TaxID=1408157 RepID=A0A1J7IVF9_9PEZI|nr:hypothetical protein CONLIGDRAFT_677944 [Coniochaeta ligniaria NRRL 30616]